MAFVYLSVIGSDCAKTAPCVHNIICLLPHHSRRVISRMNSCMVTASGQSHELHKIQWHITQPWRTLGSITPKKVLRPRMKDIFTPWEPNQCEVQLVIAWVYSLQAADLNPGLCAPPKSLDIAVSQGFSLSIWATWDHLGRILWCLETQLTGFGLFSLILLSPW